MIKDTPTCNRCGSVLIQLSQVTNKPTNFNSTLTTTKFKCSDKLCQEEADKKYVEMVLRSEQQIAAKKKRLEQKNSPKEVGLLTEQN